MKTPSGSWHLLCQLQCLRRTAKTTSCQFLSTMAFDQFFHLSFGSLQLFKSFSAAFLTNAVFYDGRPRLDRFAVIRFQISDWKRYSHFNESRSLKCLKLQMLLHLKSPHNFISDVSVMLLALTNADFQLHTNGLYLQIRSHLAAMNFTWEVKWGKDKRAHHTFKVCWGENWVNH